MLLPGGLSDEQWTDICRIGQILDSEYASRRETLIKRADFTVQSFKWLDLGKARSLAISHAGFFFFPRSRANKGQVLSCSIRSVLLT